MKTRSKFRKEQSDIQSDILFHTDQAMVLVTPLSRTEEKMNIEFHNDTETRTKILPSPTSVGHDFKKHKRISNNDNITIENTKNLKTKRASILGTTSVFIDSKNLPPLSPTTSTIPIKKQCLASIINSAKDENTRVQNRYMIPKSLPSLKISTILLSFIDKKQVSKFEISEMVSMHIRNRGIFTPIHDFLIKIQRSSVSSEMRQELMNIIQDIHIYQAYRHPETTWLAINYMDRYMSTVRCRLKQQRELLAVTAAMLAGKVMEETREPTIQTIICGSGLNFTSNQILKMEHKLLKALQWRLVPHNTPYTIFHLFMNLVCIPLSLQNELLLFLHNSYSNVFYHDKIVPYESNIVITAVLLHILEWDITAPRLKTIISLLGILPGSPYRKCGDIIRSVYGQ